MENKCEDCEHFNQCEIKIIIHNPILDIDENGVRFGVSSYYENSQSPKYEIKKGDKIAQILLKEHQGYLLGVESDEERSGGFGSSGDRQCNTVEKI